MVEFMAEQGAKDATIIKKYANRRLYHTGTSSYVTLEDLAQMVRAGEDFVVTDAKTGEDITRSVLTQIIFEQENKGQFLLPIAFLRQLIQFYGDHMQALVPRYLEMSLTRFMSDQDKLREQMTKGSIPRPSTRRLSANRRWLRWTSRSVPTWRCSRRPCAPSPSAGFRRRSRAPSPRRTSEVLLIRHPGHAPGSLGSGDRAARGHRCGQVLGCHAHEITLQIFDTP